MGMVTSLFVAKMVAAAGLGPRAGAYLASVGIDPDTPADPKLMVADTAYYDLLERIARVTDVTALPLRTGATMRCDDYGALGLAFKAAPTLQGSFARVARYARLWTTVVEYDLTPADGAQWFALHRAGPRRLGLRLSNEATLASAINIAREVAPSGPFTPLEVHFQHPAPSTTAHHTAYFGCPVVFGSDRDALLFPQQVLDRANRLGDQGLTRFLIGHLEQEMATVGQEPPLRDRLRDAIARSLSEGLPRMEDIARRLGMSVRSLHRRLADEGLSFKGLTDEARRELAEGLLRDDRYTLAEISFLTGFSEQSAFTRAFKRWCAETPANFRKRLKS